jgi:hypothetical protein
MWTAWDYLGEAGLGTWAYTKDGCTFDKPYPWLLADTGAIDILGNVEAEAEYAAVVWGLRQMPYIGVQPVNHPHDEVYKAIWRGTNAIASWAWKDCEGNRAFVEVYANTATVMLLLNGEVVGTAKVEDCRAAFELPYTPGTLTAIAYNEQGVEISRSSLVSAEGPVKISVIPEKDTVHSGEVVYVNISLIGENGIVESNADTKLTVTVEGGELLAFGSANPRTEESYNDGAFTTYYGRAQAVIRSKEPGIVSVSVTGKNFEPVQGHIKVTK